MTKQYDVGYGKPPNKHEFKKGKSGNPSGKPKRSADESPLDPKKIFIAELKSLITITENGKKTKITAMKALYKSLIQQALKGDKVARKYAMDFMLKQDKYDFEDEGVTYYRITNQQREEIKQFVEKATECAKLLGQDSNQEQGNASPSLPGPAAGSGSASSET